MRDWTDSEIIHPKKTLDVSTILSKCSYRRDLGLKSNKIMLKRFYKIIYDNSINPY